MASWHHNFRHLQHSCSSCAAVLLTFLEDIAQDYPSYCCLCIPEIRTIVLFLPFWNLWPQNKLRRAAQKICRLVVRKEDNTLSTLHWIANCIKNGTIRKSVPPTDDSVLPQCRPQLLLDWFGNLIHNIFRIENSTLEVNVNLFRVLHWQQWQPPESASVS